MSVEFQYSDSLRALPRAVVVGVVTVRGVDPAALETVLVSAERSVSFKDPGPSVMRRIQCFGSFFTQNGFRSPLGDQLKHVQEKGLPSGSPLVKALLLSEMSTGILMGAQDAAAIKGPLVCDLAAEGETFRGIRSDVLCRKDEIILRDPEGIIATLFQGPDRRTRLNKDTKDIVFFAFSVPGVSADDVQEGVEAVRSLFKAACAEIHVRYMKTSGRPNRKVSNPRLSRVIEPIFPLYIRRNEGAITLWHGFHGSLRVLSRSTVSAPPS
jgi:DNA/RNA-binding domain of Phe-tRNA-synthetase-like protein